MLEQVHAREDEGDACRMVFESPWPTALTSFEIHSVTISAFRSSPNPIVRHFAGGVGMWKSGYQPVTSGRIQVQILHEIGTQWHSAAFPRNVAWPAKIFWRPAWKEFPAIDG